MSKARGCLESVESLHVIKRSVSSRLKEGNSGGGREPSNLKSIFKFLSSYETQLKNNANGGGQKEQGRGELQSSPGVRYKKQRE